MTFASRPAVIAAGTAAALSLAIAPALASTSQPTSLTLKANKTTVTNHHHVNFTARLASQGQPLAGQTVALQERAAPTKHHKTTWTDEGATCTTDATGKCPISVTATLPAGKHTQKQQFRAVFAGATTSTTPAVTYGKSHSHVITVTVKRASS